MDLGLEGKVALITGAGSPIGFGKAIACYLAKEGCDIIVADINFDNAAQTAKEIEAIGCRALAIQVDVTDKSDVEKNDSKET
uniref:SDR family NAD(P)-dependent oxidoreductase n=1 Tax=candidate division WOR-3 bacterium TaxID=2052148 RepID=A0A7C2P6D2_UNCW3